MYQIETRYQYWSIYDGKVWTRWFKGFRPRFYDSKAEAVSAIKSLPKVVNKLKYDYRVVEVDA